MLLRKLAKNIMNIIHPIEATGTGDETMDGNDLPECPVCGSHHTKYERISGLEHDRMKHKCYVFNLCHCLDCDHWFSVKEEKDEWDRFEIEKQIEEQRSK